MNLKKILLFVMISAATLNATAQDIETNEEQTSLQQ